VANPEEPVLGVKFGATRVLPRLTVRVLRMYFHTNTQVQIGQKLEVLDRLLA
jgi:hypothetical protein